MEIVIIVGVLALIGWGVVVAAGKHQSRQRVDGAAYANAIAQHKQEIAEADRGGQFRGLSAADYGYRAVGGETLLAVLEGASFMQMRSTGRYANAGPVLSIPIVKGLRYRVSMGRYHAQKTLQAVATGRLLVTDRAFVFEGTDKNERITWTQIADIEIMADGFGVAKRSGPRRIYAVSAPDPHFAAIVELMLERAEA